MADQIQMKSVEVVLPVVKLRLQDLSYLRSLATPVPGVKCSMPSATESRLRILGLIEDKVLPPCPKATRLWRKDIRKAKRTVQVQVNKEDTDWRAIEQASYAARRTKPTERKTTVITSAGMKLVTKGVAAVQVKGSCR